MDISSIEVHPHLIVLYEFVTSLPINGNCLRNVTESHLLFHVFLELKSIRLPLSIDRHSQSNLWSAGRQAGRQVGSVDIDIVSPLGQIKRRDEGGKNRKSMSRNITYFPSFCFAFDTPTLFTFRVHPHKE